MRDKFEKTVGKAGGKLREGLDKTREAASATYEVGSDYVNKVTAVPETLESWCSWCGEFTRHDLETKRKLSRSTYYCTGCENPTIPCRYCDNMAMAAAEPPAEGELATETDEPVVLDEEELLDEGEAESSANMRQRLSQFLKSSWNHELCAEHNGAIPSFEKAKARINDLDEFAELMKPVKTNMYAVGKTTGTVIGGAAAMGTGAWILAPGIAGSMVGASALSGAAFAKVGTTGMATITAVGGGLGGRTGYGIAYDYLKAIPDFEFIPLRNDEGQDNGHRIIVINGFLSEDNKENDDWIKGLDPYFSDSHLWHLKWPAKSGFKLVGKAALKASATSFVRKLPSSLSKRVSGGAALMPLQFVGEFASGWYSALLNAQKTGGVLAEAISRTEGKTFTLMGHSLGARVVYYALEALGTKEGEKRIRNAVLLGGAVGVDDSEAWATAAAAVEGSLYNGISREDEVLGKLYRAVTLFRSKPAGINEVNHDIDNLVNVDCSGFVKGHNKWKSNLPRVVEQFELKLE